MFVVAIDGIDGVGKDTQAELLTVFLTGLGLRTRLVTCPLPDSPLKPAIQGVLAEVPDPQALQLLFIAERLLQQANWKKQLASEPVVLVRSVWATVVYGEALGIDSAWLHNLIAPVRDPDLIFLLDVPVAEAMARTPTEDPLERNTNLQEYCRNRYLQMAEAASNWVVIDGTAAVEQVHQEIVRQLTIRMPKLEARS